MPAAQSGVFILHDLTPVARAIDILWGLQSSPRVMAFAVVQGRGTKVHHVRPPQTWLDNPKERAAHQERMRTAQERSNVR